MKDLFAVIMAGGIGSRFWPRSKERKPKHLIRIFGENSMIQDTVERISAIIPKENIYIITNRVQKPRVKAQLKEIPEENIIDEPFRKNTSACIALASLIIKQKNENAIIINLPSDHLINDVTSFQQTILKAAEFAKKSDGLVTIGIKPSRPETGYGYIQIDERYVDNSVFPVLTYAEKPNLETARRFIIAGDFLWNSGIFLWRADVIFNELKKHMPDLYDEIIKLKSKLGTLEFERELVAAYGQLKSISIDYGLGEKSDNVFCIKGFFDWGDVGSWEEVYYLSDKDSDANVKIGDIYTEKTFGSYVFSPKKFTALIGVEQLIVINTNEALLICNRENSQEVKQVVDFLRMHNRTELL